MERLKKLHSNDPATQKWLANLIQITIWELVAPGRDALGRKQRFWDSGRAQAELDTLGRELAIGGYKVEEGQVVPEDVEGAGPPESDIDEVTKIPLRRFLNPAAQKVWDQCQVARVPTAALFIDADNFKTFNEISHAKGDEVLRTVAHAVSVAVQFRGVVGRWGQGDEIVAVLKNLTEDEAFALGERIRRDVAEVNIESTRITVSIGVASSDSGAKNVEELWGMADNAVHKAKTQGKNRTYRFSDTEVAKSVH
jgi:diguanylate cyclase (GGDEF)-like protein